jgi:hypothetical protein
VVKSLIDQGYLERRLQATRPSAGIKSIQLAAPCAGATTWQPSSPPSSSPLEPFVAVRVAAGDAEVAVRTGVLVDTTVVGV